MANQWPLAIAGAILLGGAFVINRRLGAALVLLVVILLATKAYSSGLLKAST